MARPLHVQSQQLPTERQVFKDEVLPGPESADHPPEEMPKQHDHGENLIGKSESSFAPRHSFCRRTTFWRDSGVISPLFSNLYLNEVDGILEKAIQTTRRERYTHVQYARFADDLVILIDSHPQHDWLVRAVEKRLREELAKLTVEINEEKSKIVDLAKGGSFTFLGFEYRRILGRNQQWRPYYAPKLKKRTALLAKLKEIFRQKYQPAGGGDDRADQPDPSWLGELFCRRRLERMLFVCQRLGREEGSGSLMRARERSGLGWKRWRTKWLYEKLGLYHDYRLRRLWSLRKVQPAPTVP
jgi:RNA-directed DNA polymerase